MTTVLRAGKAPGALPVLGHGWQLMRYPMRFLESLSDHGDLVEIKLGPHTAHVPCHPELMRQILAEDRIFDRGGPFFDKVREIVGENIATCPHHKHRRLRRRMQPAFARSRLTSYTEVMAKEADKASRSWRPGQIIDAYPTFYRLALRIVALTLFPAGMDERTLADLQSSASDVAAGVLPRVILPGLLHGLPLPANRRYERAREKLNTTVEGYLADCERGETASDDLLSSLAAPDGLDRPLNSTEIRDEMILLLVAGAEAVASTMSWALYLISQHPHVEERLHAEADRVLDGRPAQAAHLPDLPFTAAVITETLRLYPPAWILTRKTTAPVELAGVRLRAGAKIVISPPALQRQSALFPRAYAFDPDRWLSSHPATPQLPRGAFTAFGGGARTCIGQTFATIETTLTLATIAARWRAVVAPGTDLRTPLLASALHPKRLLLHVQPRTPSPGITQDLNTSAPPT
ncbi:pentalenene oxygenase [Streptomyces sp. 2132.2]|uniref:cytochrome P450 n=1 Tax=Streptomyces sp. 2132.2 TaxID=2485161 RepID=UPI000F4A8B26|nr:cytochrome P450 [Streptomyces sp. 2132.2]ROQ94427.1 pentalenene oxygenase [Streptomyces sp. 2132.2]